MPTTKYIIDLSETERKQLKEIVSKGKSPARTILRANILLASDINNKNHMTVDEIVAAYHTSRPTVEKVRAKYVTLGLEASITRKKRCTPPVPPKITGEVEAHIIALACGKAPEGYSKWTLQLLADKSVELGFIKEVSRSTIFRVLKKTNLSRT